MGSDPESSVIDAHVHVFRTGSLPAAWFRHGAERWAGSKWPPPDPASIDIEGGLVDDGFDYLLPAMDQAGVTAAICHTLDWGVSLGEPAVPTTEVHEWYGELQRRHHGRFYATAGVDPRRPNAAEILDRALGTAGLKGLKVYPPTGYRASDPACLPLYEKCIAYDVPVVVHTAFVGYPHVGRFANPLYLNDVHAALPELRIVLAHSGFPFWSEEAIEVAAHHPNSYLEISNWNEVHQRDPERARRVIVDMLDRVGAHRMLYASDHLGGRRFSRRSDRLGDWASFVREVVTDHAGQAAAELVMSQNTARVFSLDD